MEHAKFERPMKMYKDALDIDTLRSRLALRRFVCISLAKELETATTIARPALIHRREEALNECRMLELVIDFIERQKQSRREMSAA
jgi:hypothetical protein